MELKKIFIFVLCYKYIVQKVLEILQIGRHVHDNKKKSKYNEWETSFSYNVPPLTKLSPFGLQGYHFLFFLPNLVSINQCTIVNKFNYHSFSVPIYSNEQWYMLWIYSVLTDIVAVFFVGKTETVKYMYVLVCRRNILIRKKYMDYFYYKNSFHGSFKLVGWVYGV